MRHFHFGGVVLLTTEKDRRVYTLPHGMDGMERKEQQSFCVTVWTRHLNGRAIYCTYSVHIESRLYSNQPPARLAICRWEQIEIKGKDAVTHPWRRNARC